MSDRLPRLFLLFISETDLDFEVLLWRLEIILQISLMPFHQSSAVYIVNRDGKQTAGITSPARTIFVVAFTSHCVMRVIPSPSLVTGVICTIW